MTLILPYPPSSNRYWRVFRGRAVKSAEAREYQASAGWAARAAGMKTPLTGLMCVTIRVYRPRKSRDLDNCVKVPLDALNGIAWKDDSQIVKLICERFEDKDNPRLEIEIEER